MAKLDGRLSIQDIQNTGTDREFGGFPMREGVGFDGQNLQRVLADSMAVKITTSGSDTYIGLAAPGTDQATAKWQAMKYSGGVLTYADGNSSFDNTSTDLTALTYS